MRSTILFAAAAFLALGSMSGHAEDLSYFTENWAPFNWEDETGKHGITVDVLDEIFKRTDIEATLDDVQVVPWARGYERTLHTPNTVLFGTTRTKAREDLFKWAGPIYSNQLALVIPKKDVDKYKSLDDFHNVSIGTIRDDAAEQVLVEKGFVLKEFDRSTSTDSAIKKLAVGRIDAVSATASVVFWGLKKLGHNPDDYTVGQILLDGHIYYAFNPETSDDVVVKFQGAIDDMRADGIIDSIKKKYGQ